MCLSNYLSFLDSDKDNNSQLYAITVCLAKYNTQMLLVMDKVNTSYKQQKMCQSPEASHIQNEAICKARACNTGRIQNLDCKKKEDGKTDAELHQMC